VIDNNLHILKNKTMNTNFLIISIIFHSSLNFIIVECGNCPCLTSHGNALDSYLDAEGDLYYDGHLYPSDYGLSCKDHDADLAPFCNTDDNPEFCSEQFCYVDPDDCSYPLVYLSGYFPDSNLYYSYQTCGANGTFYDWFNNRDGTYTLIDLANVVETYVLSIRTDLQSDYSDLEEVTEPCATQSSCDCDICAYNSDWGQEVSFTTTGLIISSDLTATDTSTCITEIANSYFLKVVGAEYQDTSQFGTLYAGYQSDGVFNQWPAVQWCPTDYDPRFRPWYSAAITNPKVLILVIDVSGSMATNDRIDLAIEAAKAVLDTLGWKDQVGFVLFNSAVTETRDPVYVTDDQRDTLDTWIDTYVIAGGGTEFYDPLVAAIDMIDEDPGCSNVILFLTDGIADFTDENYESITSLAATNSITFFTYALGSGADSSVMKQIACDNDGIFYSVEDSDDLAKAMSSYYAYYAAAVSNTGTRWILYNDALTGTELLAACTPLYDNTNPELEISVIFGVMCIDINIFADVDTLRAEDDWDDFYAYVQSESEECLAEFSGLSSDEKDNVLEYVRSLESDVGAATCNNSNNNNKSGLSAGAVAGIVIGSIVFAICCVYVLMKLSSSNQVKPETRSTPVVQAYVVN